MAEKLKVVVERSKWLRGDSGFSMLRDEDGRMCCLGFAMRVEGFTGAQLLDRVTPQGVALSRQQWRGSRLTRLTYDDDDWSNTNWAHAAMTLNDTLGLNDAEREERLLKHCEREDSPFQFEFVD